MKRSWIDPKNQTQEIWARKYLLKKREGMTQSKEGVNASFEWGESESALSFLKRLEHKEDCEASIVLLKKMEKSWIQQMNKRRFKKSLPVNISVQSSNQLKWLAGSWGMTKIKTMEAIIANQLGAQQQAMVQQKDLHERRKQKLEQCEIALQEVKVDRNQLEQEFKSLGISNERLRKQVSEQKAEIEGLRARNRRISDLF